MQAYRGRKRIALVALLGLLALRIETENKVSFPTVPAANLSNVLIRHDAVGTSWYEIADLTYENAGRPFMTDMVLSFNSPANTLHYDDTMHYTVPHAEYDFLEGSGLGKGCASFFKERQRVEVQAAPNLWLGSCDDLGSFTLELRLLAKSLRDGGVLFSRVGYFSGSKRGIELVLERGRVVARLYRVFKSPEGRSTDVFLNRGSALVTGRWYHYSLSFDRMTGRLSSHLDGREEETFYITADGQPGNGVLTPTFTPGLDPAKTECLDMPAVVLGKNFVGCLDEVRISYEPFHALEERTPVAYRRHKDLGIADRVPFNYEGVVTSPVYSFADTGTKVTLFSWDEQLQKDTFIWMEFRIADSLFYETDTALKWYRITRNQRTIYLRKTGEGEYLRGKYYQWRAHLVPSPDGGVSPRLGNVGLTFTPDLSPQVPQQVEIVSAGDCAIVVRWKKNVDADILGYRIRYGVRQDRYDGIISTVQNMRISNTLASGNYLEMKITNDLIEENRAHDPRGVLSFPRIQNTVLYYLSVSAYDNYKPDTPFNHESAFSRQVTARPYAGSEIE